jgi:hypothetical protein
MREGWLREKNLPRLKKMLMNDPLVWQELAKEYKLVEADMESAFWGSRINL